MSSGEKRYLPRIFTGFTLGSMPLFFHRLMVAVDTPTFSAVLVNVNVRPDICLLNPLQPELGGYSIT